MSWRKFLRITIIALITSYQKYLSPLLVCAGFSGCRFFPTCSQHSIISIKKYGPIRGIGISLRQLAHCHPFSHDRNL